jgi:hypothetical protein
MGIFGRWSGIRRISLPKNRGVQAPDGQGYLMLGDLVQPPIGAILVALGCPEVQEENTIVTRRAECSCGHLLRRADADLRMPLFGVQTAYG